MLACLVLWWSRSDFRKEIPRDQLSALSDFTNPSRGAFRWTLGDKVAWREASEADFNAVPGLGPKQRRQILDWQQQQGVAQSWEEVLAIPGVGAKAVQQLKKYFYFFEVERPAFEF